MKSQATKTALAIVVVIGLAAAFWMLLLAPKREKAAELGERTEQLSAEVSTEQLRAAAGLEAKHNFPRNYQQLILLGKAVPAEAATPSLLVQLSGVGARSETDFQSITTGGEGGGSPEATEATESAASLLPLGASIGAAGLGAMPYALEFDGGFFDIADFIEGIDALVETKDGTVDAKGRLITIDGFNLAPSGEEEGSSSSDLLHASFSVTTYVTPPGQGLTAGATPEGPSTTPVTTTP